MKYHIRPLLAATLLVAFFASVATAFSQTIYVSNPNNSTISSYTTGGAYTPFASTGGGSYPEGITVDSAGNLYVAYNASGTGHTIERFAPNGTGTLFGTTTAVAPRNLAFDSSGNLYALMQNGTIEKFGPGGGSSTLFTTTGVGNPLGLAVDGAGNFYVADYNSSGSISKFDSSGTSLGVFSSTGLNLPTTLAFDDAGNLYATNNGNNSIEKFTSAGVASVFASSLPGTPDAMAFDAGTATFYVAFNNINRIDTFNLSGTDLGIFTTTGLSNPDAIVISAVPEPSTAALLAGCAVFGVIVWRRRGTFLTQQKAGLR